MLGEMVPCVSPSKISIFVSEELAAREGNREKQNAAVPASVDCRNPRRVFKVVSCVTGNCVTKSVGGRRYRTLKESGQKAGTAKFLLSSHRSYGTFPMARP